MVQGQDGGKLKDPARLSRLRSGALTPVLDHPHLAFMGKNNNVPFYLGCYFIFSAIVGQT